MFRFRRTAIIAITLSISAAFAANASPERARRAAMIDVGRADPSIEVEDVVLSIPMSAEAEARLQILLRDQLDPSSPRYEQWISPEEFGERFGPSRSEVDALVNALRAEGLRPGAIAKSRAWIRFSGRAGQIENAFGVQVRQLESGGDSQLHLVVTGSARAPLGEWSRRVFLSDDLRGYSSARRTAPDFVSQGVNYLAPQDYVTIYNIGPIYDAGFKGSAVNIAVVGQSTIDLADVQQFRTYFGLPSNDPDLRTVGVSPGKTGDEIEGDLDVEWAGAIAPLSHIRYYVADAAGNAAAQAVDDNWAPILSVSYGLCESMDLSEAPFYNHLWQQASAQGISVFVSSGDAGASGCDSINANSGTGLGVNLYCTPDVTCVGGTQFDDTANPSAYWNATNDPVNKSSARSYIPEIAWNESGGGNGLAASGGGMSTVFNRPSYQSVTGMPAGTMRCQPDIASNAGHVAYIIFNKSKAGAVVGTSAAAPAVAATIGLISERFGQRLGLINPTLYQLANAQYNGGATVFHDITSGTNSVPNVKGYDSGVGYDMVTGLGSIDAGALTDVMSRARKRLRSVRPR